MENEEYYEEDVGSTNSTESSNKFQEQMTPQMIRDRIRKRRPNPQLHLTSKRMTYQRFSDRCTRGAQTYSQWHDVDFASNRNGKRKLIILDDGTEYIGEWQDNLRNGSGTHYTAKGYYAGHFVDDKYDGSGEYYIWSDETNCDQPGVWLLYVGNWEKGRYHGNGILYSTDHSVYNGDFIRGKKCGQGMMCYANQDTYNGGWDNDMRNGEGEFAKESGDVFRGIYRDDKRNGDGILHIAKSKRRLEGYWVDDMLKCGSYYDDTENAEEPPKYAQPDDISGTTDGLIPVIEAKDADAVLTSVINEIEQQQQQGY